jgi:predicted 3-demethylubiquinone-9 3-methyltransferase (glyoxalase superfamily)
MMQSINPCLWFDNQAEEAARYYASLFPNARVHEPALYPEGGPGEPGTPMLVEFELAGQRFIGLNGGPQFQFTPAISFTVACDTEEEIDRLFERLLDGGETLMPLQAYPFAEKYGWLNDRYGVSWQLGLWPDEQKITPSLLFVGEKAGKAAEAMEHYTSLFPGSGIEQVHHYGPDQGEPEGNVAHAVFRLNGQPFIAMDSSQQHDFDFSHAISLMANCDTQAEIDHLWDGLLDGGEAEQCGWLADRYGVAWQVIPANIGDLMDPSDPERARRVSDAVFSMVKIDLHELQRLYEGVPA